jgi:hypothetical protein
MEAAAIIVYALHTEALHERGRHFQSYARQVVEVWHDDKHRLDPSVEDVPGYASDVPVFDSAKSETDAAGLEPEQVSSGVPDLESDSSDTRTTSPRATDDSPQCENVQKNEAQQETDKKKVTMKNICVKLIEYSITGCKVCDQVRRFSNQHKQTGTILRGAPHSSVLYCDTLHTGKIDNLMEGKVNTPILTMTLIVYGEEGTPDFKWYGAKVMEQGANATATRQAIIDFCTHGTGVVRTPHIVWTDPGSEFNGSFQQLLDAVPSLFKKVSTPFGASTSNGAAEALNKMVVKAIRVLCVELGIQPYQALQHMGLIMERINEAERVKVGVADNRRQCSETGAVSELARATPEPTQATEGLTACADT